MNSTTGEPDMRGGPDNPLILHGARFELEVARDPDEVFAYLTDVPNTPQWRTHLTSVD